jgi:hydrogenase nickel incorporation protein HypA/HybF
MHEFALTQSIVDICTERAQGARVSRVTLEIGALSGVVDDAIRFCFDVCTGGTPLEGAALEIVTVAGRGRCAACGRESDLAEYPTVCSCGGAAIECIAGDRLIVKSMEVNGCAQPAAARPGTRSSAPTAPSTSGATRDTGR